MDINFEAYAKIFKAISDPKRLQILALLSDGELCACKILEQFQITQPTLSHDMKLLYDAGFVTIRKDGKWSHYSLNRERFAEIQSVLSAICACQKANPANHCCN